MTNQLVFKCPITNYVIEYIVDIKNKTAYMNTILYDYSTNSKNIKLWLQLIRSSIEQLKNQQIEQIVQTVTYQDYENLLKKKNNNQGFNLKTKYDSQEICEISCPIDNFMSCLAKGLGL